MPILQPSPYFYPVDNYQAAENTNKVQIHLQYLHQALQELEGNIQKLTSSMYALQEKVKKLEAQQANPQDYEVSL